jgi:hypothetical protein
MNYKLFRNSSQIPLLIVCELKCLLLSVEIFVTFKSSITFYQVSVILSGETVSEFMRAVKTKLSVFL